MSVVYASLCRSMSEERQRVKSPGETEGQSDNAAFVISRKRRSIRVYEMEYEGGGEWNM